MRTFNFASTSLILVLALSRNSVTYAGEASLTGPAQQARAALADAAAKPPEAAAALKQSHQRLSTSLERLRSDLRASGPKVIASWDKLLELPALQAELGRPEPDLSALTKLEDQLRQNFRGL